MGFTITLELVGTGYRASTTDKELTLNVGYSNPRVLAIPQGISCKVRNGIAGICGMQTQARRVSERTQATKRPAGRLTYVHGLYVLSMTVASMEVVEASAQLMEGQESKEKGGANPVCMIEFGLAS
jgi:hypothetical protein